jgi:hypothetical protein
MRWTWATAAKAWHKAQGASEMKDKIFAAAVSACAVLALLAPGAGRAQQAASGDAAGTDHMAEAQGPKYSLETIGSVEYARMRANDGPSRGPDAKLRLDSTFLVEWNDELSLDGLFQYKPRAPLSADDPNKELFINQGPGRREGGKFKELYVRYGEYRVGKFVQDFGRAYAFLPTLSPQAGDFTEESEQGYEPSEMIGVEKIHVFDDESHGWRQLTLSAFMADKTLLHRSFPYDEGRIHLHDGGIGNTRLPENVMATLDVLRQPVGNWAQLDYQASIIRWGKTAGAERAELWTTLGGNLNIPVRGSVEDTLSERFGMVRVYVEAARRENFSGVAGRNRNYLSAAASYLAGPWQLSLTGTQRMTTDHILATEHDRLYTTSVGYTFPTRTVLAISAGHEQVGSRGGAYLGLRLTQTLTSCSKCVAHEKY